MVGVFPSETSAATSLATEIALRSSEQWALKRYLTMDALKAKNRTHNIRDIDGFVRGQNRIFQKQKPNPCVLRPTKVISEDRIYL